MRKLADWGLVVNISARGRLVGSRAATRLSSADTRLVSQSLNFLAGWMVGR